MAGALREILVAFGFEIDDKTLDQLEQKLENVIGVVKTFAEAFGGFAILKKMNDFTESQIAAGEELNNMSRRLGITSHDLQLLSFAADDVSFEGLTTGIRFLNRNLGEAAEDGGAAQKAFAALKIDLKDGAGQIRPTVDLFEDVAEKIAGMGSIAEQTSYTMKIFGRGGAELLPFLQEGKAGIEDARKAFEDMGGAIDKSFLVQSKAAGQELHRLKMSFDILKMQVGQALIPGFLKTTQVLSKMVAIFRKFAKETTFFDTLFPAIKIGIAVFSVVKLFQAVNQLGGAMRILSILTPFAGWVLAIGLVYLAIDDIYNLIEGNRSLIGDWLNSFMGVDSARIVVEGLKNAWVETQNVVESGVRILADYVASFGHDLLAIVDGLKAVYHAGAALATLAVGDKAGAKAYLAQAGENASGAGAHFQAAGQRFGQAFQEYKPLPTYQYTPGQTVGPPPPSGSKTESQFGARAVNAPITINNTFTGVKDAAALKKAIVDGSKVAGTELRNASNAIAVR